MKERKTDADAVRVRSHESQERETFVALASHCCLDERPRIPDETLRWEPKQMVIPRTLRVLRGTHNGPEGDGTLTVLHGPRDRAPPTV